MSASTINKLSQQLLKRDLKVATAESCTAGLVAKLLTDQAGSSAWFERGFVTYSNEAKVEMLGVSSQILDSHGAVSCETVHEMAAGAIKKSHADLSIAISGIAGPDGGTDEKPVGTVWFAWAAADRVEEEAQHFDGDREAVRGAAADYALAGLLRFISE